MTGRHLAAELARECLGRGSRIAGVGSPGPLDRHTVVELALNVRLLIRHTAFCVEPQTFMTSSSPSGRLH